MFQGQTAESFTLSHLICTTTIWSSYFFLIWIYLGDIDSQSHTGFKCTTQQDITCTQYCAPITPFAYLPLLPTPFPLAGCVYSHTIVCACGYFCQPLHFPSSSPPLPPPWQLTMCFMCPCQKWASERWVQSTQEIWILMMGQDSNKVACLQNSFFSFHHVTLIASWNTHIIFLGVKI